jgi:GNAT superfamily N-acetyltransferase
VTGDHDFIRRRTTEVTLRDGTPIRLRPIVPDDKAHLADGFRRMSPESRYRRFMAPLQELSDEMLADLTEVDYRDHFAYIAFAVEEGGLVGAGVARYVRVPGDREVAEAAVTVVDEYQGRGLGTLLLDALGAVALENGVRRFRAYALESNRPLLELVAEMGARVAHDSPGLVRVEVDLPAREEELRRTPIYRLFRALARGERPIRFRFREFWSRPAEG